MCNSVDGIGFDCANNHRKGLSIFNFILVLIGFICGCVAAAGAFRDERIIHALPWMTYTLANYTLTGYTTVNGKRIPEYAADRPTNPETYYGNLWGCTDDKMSARLKWADYPAVNDTCADSYVPMLWGIGVGLVLTLVTMLMTFTRMNPDNDKTKCWCVFFAVLAIIVNMSFLLGVWSRCFHSVYDRDMHPHFGVGAYAYLALIVVANWCNFLIHLSIPVHDDDCHGTKEETQRLNDLEQGAAPVTKKSKRAKSPEGRKKSKKGSSTSPKQGSGTSPTQGSHTKPAEPSAAEPAGTQ